MQKEDVYESEDVPWPEPADNSETTENQDIEKIYVDIDEAMRQFGNRILNADDVDFSDSLAKKKRRGYRSGNYVLELVGENCTEPETLQQKFRRVRYELEELAELVDQETENKKHEANLTAVYKSELNRLNDLLHAATLKHEANANIDVEAPSPPIAEDAQLREPIGSRPTQSAVRALDERLKRVEKAVSSGAAPSASQRPAGQSADEQDFAARLNDLITLKDHLEKKTENQKVMLYELKHEATRTVAELMAKVTRLEEELAKLKS